MFLLIIQPFPVAVVAAVSGRFLHPRRKPGTRFFLKSHVFWDLIVYDITFLFSVSSLKAEITWSLFSATSFKPSTALGRKIIKKKIMIKENKPSACLLSLRELLLEQLLPGNPSGCRILWAASSHQH